MFKVQPGFAPGLRKEIHSLLDKEVIRTVSPNDAHSGFYSHYFVVPKTGSEYLTSCYEHSS